MGVEGGLSTISLSLLVKNKCQQQTDESVGSCALSGLRIPHLFSLSLRHSTFYPRAGPTIYLSQLRLPINTPCRHPKNLEKNSNFLLLQRRRRKKITLESRRGKIGNDSALDCVVFLFLRGGFVTAPDGLLLITPPPPPNLNTNGCVWKGPSH